MTGDLLLGARYSEATLPSAIVVRQCLTDVLDLIRLHYAELEDGQKVLARLLAKIRHSFLCLEHTHPWLIDVIVFRSPIGALDSWMDNSRRATVVVQEGGRRRRLNAGAIMRRMQSVLTRGCANEPAEVVLDLADLFRLHDLPDLLWTAALLGVIEIRLGTLIHSCSGVRMVSGREFKGRWIKEAYDNAGYAAVP